MQARSLSRSRCQRRLPACTLVFSAFLRPCGREKARMRAGLRPQSATWVVPSRQAQRHLLPTVVSPAVPSRASPRPCAALPNTLDPLVYVIKALLKYQELYKFAYFFSLCTGDTLLKLPPAPKGSPRTRNAIALLRGE